MRVLSLLSTQLRAKDISRRQIDKFVEHFLPHFSGFKLLPLVLVHATHAARVHLVFRHLLELLLPLPAHFACLLELGLWILDLAIFKLLQVVDDFLNCVVDLFTSDSLTFWQSINRWCRLHLLLCSRLARHVKLNCSHVILSQVGDANQLPILLVLAYLIHSSRRFNNLISINRRGDDYFSCLSPRQRLFKDDLMLFQAFCCLDITAKSIICPHLLCIFISALL